MPEAVVIRPGDIDASFAAAWDRLPSGRGVYADICDSHAWFEAWLSVSPKGTADGVRIVAVMEDGQPVAVLPILLSRSGRRAVVVGMTSRTRMRPAIGTERPSPDVLRPLAEAVARTGIGDLNLHRMPSNDPATASLVDAFRDAGYHVRQHERSWDNLTTAGSGWEEYAQAHKGYAKYAKRFTNRLESLWSIDVITYGTTPGRSVVEGFDVFDRLHQRSWKKGLDAAGRARRLDLLKRAEKNGWARVYVLQVDGVPAAAHIWMRLGGVATWLSTAYDQRLAALSPGTVMMWQAQSRIFAEEDVPCVVDLLPGATSEKDRLTTNKPPLLVTEAVRPSVWSGALVPTRRHVRRVSAAVAARVRARRRNAATSALYSHVLTTKAAPGRLDGMVARRLDMTAAHRRYIASANGHSSPEKMTADWGEGDEWWAVGADPSAIIRISVAATGAVAREIIRIDPESEPVVSAGRVASGMGRAITFDGVPVFDAVLPWPRAWTLTDVGGDR